jgi:hypothetical protein
MGFSETGSPETASLRRSDVVEEAGAHGGQVMLLWSYTAMAVASGRLYGKVSVMLAGTAAGMRVVTAAGMRTVTAVGMRIVTAAGMRVVTAAGMRIVTAAGMLAVTAVEMRAPTAVEMRAAMRAVLLTVTTTLKGALEGRGEQEMAASLLLGVGEGRAKRTAQGTEVGQQHDCCRSERLRCC